MALILKFHCNKNPNSNNITIFNLFSVNNFISSKHNFTVCRDVKHALISFKLTNYHDCKQNNPFKKIVTINHQEMVVETLKEASERKPNTKEFEYRHDNTWLFPNISRGNKYYLDMVGEHKYPKFSETMGLGKQMYKVEIQWNGQKLPGNCPKY